MRKTNKENKKEARVLRKENKKLKRKVNLINKKVNLESLGWQWEKHEKQQKKNNIIITGLKIEKLEETEKQ